MRHGQMRVVKPQTLYVRNTEKRVKGGVIATQIRAQAEFRQRLHRYHFSESSNARYRAFAGFSLANRSTTARALSF
jgi:hypothetical protein